VIGRLLLETYLAIGLFQAFVIVRRWLGYRDYQMPEGGFPILVAAYGLLVILWGPFELGTRLYAHVQLRRLERAWLVRRRARIRGASLRLRWQRRARARA